MNFLRRFLTVALVGLTFVGACGDASALTYGSHRALTGGSSVIGANALLAGETDGLAVDFTASTGTGLVSVKDTTTPANNLSNVPADAFWSNAGTSPKLVTKADGSLAWSPHNLAIRSEDFTTGWSSTGTPVTTTHTIQDDDAAAFESISQSISAVSGAVYTGTAWFLKDADTSRFPALSLSGTLSTVLHVNTSTGATAFESNTIGASVVVVDEGTLWRVSITFTADNGNIVYRIYPARGTTLGTSSSAAVGTINIPKVQFNRGPIPTTYLATTAAARIGLPIDYANGAYGLFVEIAVTNPVIRSQEFDHASWVKSSITVTANSIANPLGELNADTLTATGTNGFVSTSGSVNANAPRLFSVFLKRKTGTGNVSLEVGRTSAVASALDTTWRRFSVLDTVLLGTYAVVSNVITVTAAGHGLLAGEQVRLIFTSGTATNTNFVIATVPDANTFTVPQVTADTSGNVTIYASMGRIKLATSGDEIYAWGGQLDAGLIVTSPIPTYGAATTRAADDISANLTALPYSITAGSFVASAIFQDTTPVSEGGRDSTFMAVDNGLIGASIRLTRASASNKLDLVVVDTANQCDITSAASVGAGVLVKGAARWATNDFHQALNGTLALTPDVSGTLPTAMTKIRFGSVTGVGRPNAHIYTGMWLPRVLSNAELQARTAP